MAVFALGNYEKATINVLIEVLMWTHVFKLFEKILSCAIAWLYGRTMFNLIRNC